MHRDYGVTKTEHSPHCRLRSADLRWVRWTRGFWADRFRQCAEVTLPHLWDLLADPSRGHALANLRIAAGLEEGEFAGTHWQDEWVYKWLEAAASIYAHTADPELDRRMDEIISIIERAQEPDGYIATQTTVRGWPRFQEIIHHELYVMGHLITAACLHHRITGKDNFLQIARRAGDCIYRTFKSRDPALAHFPFNPTIIMASVELYRTTGDPTYLDMANLFVDMRASAPGGTDQNQDFVPLREETEVVGHAVLFTYLYAGAADVYMETGDRSILNALERLWHDLTEKKMYLTGGCCAVHRGLSIRWRDGRATAAFDVHEAAGAEYELPNSTAYNETCAQIGDMMWNWRMLAISGDARYADVMERSWYNSILPGIGLDGASWFYTNVLRWYGEDHRLLSQDAHERFQPGMTHICCPSNLLRTIAELHGYFYSTSDEGLWVHHYGGNTFDGSLRDGTRMTLTQETDYPWEGRVLMTVEPAEPTEFALMLRIPEWAEGATLSVNGRAPDVAAQPATYAQMRRTWSPGDTIELTLPMPPRLIEAHPKVEALRGQVAVMRGPVVYCLESPDLPEGVRVSEVRVPRGVQWTVRHDPALLHGVTVVEGRVRREPEGDWTGKLYRPLP
ncbi:MAG: glycoside hydrolase family 127 protein, partial [Armatimonadota bacterium]